MIFREKMMVFKNIFVILGLVVLMLMLWESSKTISFRNSWIMVLTNMVLK
jgi:hypothetical protein